MSGSTSVSRTSDPPYYAVIFTSRLTKADEGYREVADRMVELSSRYPGFLGIDSARGADGLGITVCYWRDEASILAWKCDPEHASAQRTGAAVWYENYEVRIAKVERAYGFARTPSP
jgi:heme-degrading monooxygenase HmoA